MELQELLNSVDRIKVSIVMQVNLDDYKNARTESIAKFVRAVNSFQDQMYKNSELIIVSDGCKKTHQIYNRSFVSDPSIKFLYLDRRPDELKMYETKEGDPEEYKCYRGFARRAGVGIATGDIITYMDSDDVLAPEFAMTLMLIYNQAPEKDWWINNTWYEHASSNESENDDRYGMDVAEQVSLPYIKHMWKQSLMKPGKFVMSPWTLTHKAGLSVHWRDVYGNMSEDVDFSTRLRAAYPNGTMFSKPMYVKCHLKNKFDI